MTPCDPDFNGGYPVLLIKRDFDPKSATYLEDLLTVPIFGPNFVGQGISLLEGYSGFYHTPITQIRENYAYQEGSTPSDYPRVEERIMDFSVGVQGRSWSEFVQVETLLWFIMKPPKGKRPDFVLRMYFGPGEDDWREITVRLERTPKDLMKLGPGLTTKMQWDLTALACDPYWYSRTLQDTVTFDTGSGTGANRISQRTLVIDNFGDQECWLEYASNELTATSTFTLPDALGVYPSWHTSAGQRIYVPLPPLGVGKSFLVQTNPLQIALEAMDDSQEVANLQGDFNNALPPHTVGAKLPVTLKGGTAQTQLSVYAIQRFDRWFGGQAL
ncbi:hypothetical protein [Rhodococcus erythropolis]|uniref:hypothetical protein n=1 Tax=Rhodococcus erythropolis TaxID=1833 RepID=UPI00366FA4D4